VIVSAKQSAGESAALLGSSVAAHGSLGANPVFAHVQTCANTSDWPAIVLLIESHALHRA